MNSTPDTPWFVAIGASGGEGLEDLRALLNAFPKDLPAVVLAVLHRPIDRLSNLRAVLARSCAMPVVIAEQNERLEPGVVYIGEPAEHLRLASRHLGELVPDIRESHRNRTVDLLFASLAAHGRGRVIGVVLSGALDDGARGLAAIADAGGLTMAVSGSHGACPGMPEHAGDIAGALDVVGEVAEIAAAVLRAVAGGPAPPESRLASTD
jgi:two-component system chemotaxis response regulator CheB